ncbi:MAG: PD-(D/E)XK nuclease family protein [Candidatus Woesearchaeota archaeon]|jgi:ATP-dependent exoDNAse (exonuclease V) beta subunit|nr:PD-(D/E)XK nuclease family protein [Candidatus Woesearchaeota archaeon]
MKLKLENSHERDSSIIFDEKPHIYYINKKPYDISVTGFVHNFFPKFDADKIIDKMMNSNNWENSKYYGMTKEEIIEEWEDNRNLAAHQGTIMHKDIELHYNDEKVSNNSSEFTQFLEFTKEHLELKPYRTEWEIFDEDLMLAGSIDMLFEAKDGTLIIYDWKRSKDIKEDNRWDSGYYPLSHLPHANYWHYSLQLNIYKKILENKYNKKISEMNLLWLHPINDSYVKLKVSDLTNEVESMFEERKKYLKNI